VSLLDFVRRWTCLTHHRTGKDELLETAMALHKAAMEDDYFIKRKLAPNVDFWCVLWDFFPMCVEANIRYRRCVFRGIGKTVIPINIPLNGTADLSIERWVRKIVVG